MAYGMMSWPSWVGSRPGMFCQSHGFSVVFGFWNALLFLTDSEFIFLFWFRRE